MKRIAVIFALMSVPAAALAGDRVWTSGHDAGITEANVVNRRGVTLRVACPDAALNKPPSLSLDVPDLEGGENKRVATLINVDGRSVTVDFHRRVLDQNQVVYTWDAAGQQRTVFDDVVFSLTHGRSASVTINSERIRETFPLSGARAALEACSGD